MEPPTASFPGTGAARSVCASITNVLSDRVTNDWPHAVRYAYGITHVAVTMSTTMFGHL